MRHANRQLRDYKLACFPITEALRIGLIDRHTAFVQMRQAYVDVYGEPKATPTQQSQSTTTTEQEQR
jgi:hypothetical protein